MIYDNGLVPNEYLTWDWYQHNTPLYLQNSNGFLSHFSLWYRNLAGDTDTGLSPTANIILNSLAFNDPDVMSEASVYNDDLVEKVLKLYGFDPTIMISYYDNNQWYSKQITINKNEQILLIRAQSMVRNWDGSTKQYFEIAKALGLQVGILPVGNLARVVLVQDNSHRYTQNVVDMFLGRLLLPNPIGGEYKYEFVNNSIANLLDSDGKVLYDSNNDKIISS